MSANSTDDVVKNNGYDVYHNINSMIVRQREMNTDKTDNNLLSNFMKIIYTYLLYTEINRQWAWNYLPLDRLGILLTVLWGQVGA